jgi:uncharacterized protein (DUF362 family)
MKQITRRHFLDLSTRCAVGTSVVLHHRLGSAAAAPLRAEVIVAKGVECETSLTAALEALGGARCLARPGERVVLKPTVAWNRPPHLAANTNPFVVQALARLCLDAGARTVTVFDRTSFRADVCYAISGLAGAVAQLRAPQVRLVTLTPQDFIALDSSGERVCRYAIEADRFINVPQAKHHALRGVALGAANLLGAVSGSAPLEERFLVWCLAQLRPSLTVLDATRILVRNGPAGGNPLDVEYRQTLAVSTDPLAADAYGCRLLGRDWRQFNYLRLGSEAGLGQANLDRVQIKEV